MLSWNWPWANDSYVKLGQASGAHYLSFHCGCSECGTSASGHKIKVHRRACGVLTRSRGSSLTLQVRSGEGTATFCHLDLTTCPVLDFQAEGMQWLCY